MKYSEKTIKRIKADKELRLMLALQLKLTEQAVNNAIANNGDAVKRYDAVMLISKRLNIPPDELFDATHSTSFSLAH